MKKEYIAGPSDTFTRDATIDSEAGIDSGELSFAISLLLPHRLSCRNAVTKSETEVLVDDVLILRHGIRDESQRRLPALNLILELRNNPNHGICRLSNQRQSRRRTQLNSQ